MIKVSKNTGFVSTAAIASKPKTAVRFRLCYLAQKANFEHKIRML